ncbi:MAG: DUF1446 domain-containing protein [Gemmatales bacterium]|nr:DUF1446 domain-containing protein [Gemmatales bacterium]MDW8387936.1 acyclic terpene utilization AtuA family protein [Gemmatales bacterium]
MPASIRIGNGCGFWGDNLDAPILLASQAHLDYLTLEYLAELTMSILAAQKQRDPEAGFATDFLDVLRRLVPILRDQPRLRIVTNAGGMNPSACARKARKILDDAGLCQHKIGIVLGDDIRDDLPRLIEQGHDFRNLDIGESLRAVLDRVVSANVYLGAAPIVEAFKQGASIVITGRVADASLTVAPAVFEFGWSWEDWDRLAAATVAGHLIECGAQATGGLWVNWREAPDLANVGYPFVDIEPDGHFVISKPLDSGGRVNLETVAEQLLYEVGDPSAYFTPDVVADFTSVSLRDLGSDRVEIRGARGKPAPRQLKVSVAYRDGFTASGMLAVFGPDAADKARRCGEMLLERVRRAGLGLEHANVECPGSGDVVPGVLPPPSGLCEVMLRVSVRDSRREAVERFTKEFAPLVTSGPPGVTGYTTGRPQVREVFAYWPTLIDRHVVLPTVELL